MIKYYSILAVIYAISECCYHFANDVISIEVTNLDNRSSYIALKTFISNTIQLLLPITFGTSITLYSFTNIGIYISIFCLIGCIFCFFIQLDEEDNFYDYENEENNRKEDFTPITFIKRVNGDKLTLIKDFFVSAMFYGLFEKVFQLLFIYVIMLNYNSLISLGVILTIMAFFSLIVGYFYHKCGNKHSKTILIICCILVFIAALSLMYNINSKIAAIIFGLCIYGANTIFGSMYSTCKGNVSNNDNYYIVKK